MPELPEDRTLTRDWHPSPLVAPRTQVAPGCAKAGKRDKTLHVLGCSRREAGPLASKPGEPIKGYASGKFLRLGLGSAVTSGSRNGGSAPDPHLYEVAYANRRFKETD